MKYIKISNTGWDLVAHIPGYREEAWKCTGSEVAASEMQCFLGRSKERKKIILLGYEVVEGEKIEKEKMKDLAE